MVSGHFVPTRAAALERLRDFVPHVGADYAAGRNHDRGAGAANDVSQLSPYLRHRLLSEEAVVSAVLQQHKFLEAERFISEVCWRTYWKGWLELHPAAWTRYQLSLQDAIADAAADVGLRTRLDAAMAGRSGIACFDHWVRELLHSGYLHNHARMWFASIWIFTLRLPWACGADFFLQHLLDGDPASNTLSWRWVAGLQTPGKHYLARAENIARFTAGRFNPVGELNESAPPLPEEPGPPLQPLPALPTADPALRSGWLLHEDDLQARWPLPDSLVSPQLRVMMPVTTARAPRVTAFINEALEDTDTRAAGFCVTRASSAAGGSDRAWLDALVSMDIRQLVTAEAPIGPARDQLDRIEPQLAAHEIRLVRVRSEWDAAFWPQATRGFFPFRKRIRPLLAERGLLP